MSVDVRTRVDPATPVVRHPGDAMEELAVAFALGADRLARGVAHLAPAPLAVRVGDRAWTLACAGDRAIVTWGAEAGTAEVVLTEEALTDLVDDQATPMGWFSSGQLQATARLSQLLDWWVLVRAALDGTQPHVPGDIALTDPDGRPLDLARRFDPGEPVEEMRAHLEAVGFLLLAGVFTEAEMAQVSADMDAATPSYRPGDGRSWWARTDDGRERLVRMHNFNAASPTTDELLGSDRFDLVARIAGDGHRWGTMPANRVEALFKPLGVVEGISDVPWHKDCSLGRHSYDCAFLTGGVSVTGADATSGQLRVVAGSHRALVWPALPRVEALGLPVVDLPTRTGDVTVHLSCTLHMAQPPVERERRVLYTSFRLPPVDRDAEQRGRAKLRATREAAPTTVSQVPAPR